MPDYCSLDLEAIRKQTGTLRSPFTHQQEAFIALDRLYLSSPRSARGALLVLPTGAGKTFTSVNWICRKVLPAGMKVLWLAQAFHLLDQAAEAFSDNARHIPPPARFLNFRIVSSHPEHDQVSSIAPTDDVVIITTQTAVSAINHDALGLDGTRFVTSLECFVKDAANSGLLVVLDEAHHAPAYGCRTLLGRIRALVPDMQLLGLTATPTYSDEERRGWLGRIFPDGKDGVVYKAEQANLMAQGILARPVFQELPTGLELEVDNVLYRRLVQEHKDLPDDLVERLARDSARNDYIVNHYVEHRDTYGKTIIFADRWFQCEYIKTKLLERNIKAGAVFSQVDATPASEIVHRRTTSVENAETIRRFKEGDLDVLVNVRMLTEGTDVPDTRSVFVTRQTTSSILFTQMIGRALRGKKAGGGTTKDSAHIVLFMDKWKHLLDVWASPNLKGGTSDTSVIHGHRPMVSIAIHLVEELARRIQNPEPGDDVPYLEHVPIGWYQTDYTVAVSEGGAEANERVREFVMVFGHEQEPYARFLEETISSLPEEWGKEDLATEWIEPQVSDWIQTYFGEEAEDIGRARAHNLASLARHMGANGTKPSFIRFEAREQFDMDQLAEGLYERNAPAQIEALQAAFASEGSLWPIFYQDNFAWFKQDFDAAIMRVYYRRSLGQTPKRNKDPHSPPPGESITKEEMEKLRKDVLERDGNKCQSCGARGKGVKLQMDHITSRDHGGATTLQNLQTLCSVCNGIRYKGVNDINFRSNRTPLCAPKPPNFLPCNPGEQAERALRRLVNFFYHCGAVREISIHQRRNGKNFSTWDIALFEGNDSSWLLAHKEALLTHIHDNFCLSHVTDITVR